jgi:hypothetical protein
MSSAFRSTDPPSGRLLRELTGLDAEQQAERLAYLDLRPEDCETLRRLAPFAERTVDDIVAGFYEHLLKFPELAALLREKPLRLERLKVMQRAYFLDITEGRFDEWYFETRLRVGDAHGRVGSRRNPVYRSRRGRPAGACGSGMGAVVVATVRERR